ncbi:unnamed protein product [Ceutorhynchus assimilis]|uniref:Peptidase S1 domain-containing protein n=1 Tax=Ceutorhynchus assimilis TaxID=467358 RepID=A0A9N9QRC4_9CUCU|nr:unnamed protein product [Ceutorhynchus assimilis]
MNTPGQDLMERRTNILSYDIHFPFQNAIPKITRIEYNQRTYCTGPPEERNTGAYYGKRAKQLSGQSNLVSIDFLAARCTNFFKIQVVQTDDILFVFGRTNLKHWATSGAVTRGASFVRTNPDFNANSGHGDLSVITLDKPVEFSSTIAPICLWEGDDNIQNMVNKKGTVAGWGADEVAQKTGKYSISVAKSVDMPIVAQESCLFSNLSYFQLTSDVTFCAGKRDGTGTCIGDSGAGFMMNKNGKFYLRGLASLVLSDKGKCDLTNFMVFCDAAKLTDWIRDAMTI